MTYSAAEEPQLVSVAPKGQYFTGRESGQNLCNQSVTHERLVREGATSAVGILSTYPALCVIYVRGSTLLVLSEGGTIVHRVYPSREAPEPLW